MAIQIDLGLQEYEIQGADGSALGVIRFNPSDPGMAARWEEAVKNITEITRKATDMKELSEIGGMDKQVKTQLDYVFGSPVSEVVFGGVSSLALCPDGTLVVEKVLDGLLPVVQQAMDAAMKASQKRVNARTGKYTAARTAGLAPGQA